MLSWAFHLVRACASIAAIALPVASHACDARLQSQILDAYTERFHRLWGEQSERRDVDQITDALANEVEPLLTSVQLPNCRFLEIVERALPRQPRFGPKLASDAKAIGVIFEFTSDGAHFCVGLNNDRKIGTPIDERLPYQPRKLEGPFKLSYTHYAMKCYGPGGELPGYRYY